MTCIDANLSALQVKGAVAVFPSDPASSLVGTASKRTRLAENISSDESNGEKVKSLRQSCNGEARRSKLVGERAPPHALWVYKLRDEKRRCFTGYLPGAVPETLADSLFEIINKETPWTSGNRSSTAWGVKPPCSCTYRYSFLGDQPASVPGVQPSAWPDWMDEVLRHVMPLCGIGPEGWPNSCNINHYEDGWEGVGWHADDEPLFQGAHQD